jgi:hypothetical protein
LRVVRFVREDKPFNPFAGLQAEKDVLLEDCFVLDPTFYLLQHRCPAVQFFPPGGGRSGTRVMLGRHFRDSGNGGSIVVECTHFDHLHSKDTTPGQWVDWILRPIMAALSRYLQDIDLPPLSSLWYLVEYYSARYPESGQELPEDYRLLSPHPSPRSLTIGIAELIKGLGVEPVYVLIDPQISAEDREVATNVIDGCLEHLELLTDAGLSIKFLLPRYLESELRGRLSQSNVLVLAPREWTDKERSEFLQRRLQTASNGQFNSLGALATLSLQTVVSVNGEYSSSIDGKVVGQTGTPREVLFLGNELIRTCARRYASAADHDKVPGSALVITEEDWIQAMDRLETWRAETQAPFAIPSPQPAPEFDEEKVLKRLQEAVNLLFAARATLNSVDWPLPELPRVAYNRSHSGKHYLSFEGARKSVNLQSVPVLYDNISNLCQAIERTKAELLSFRAQRLETLRSSKELAGIEADIRECERSLYEQASELLKLLRDEVCA